MREAAVEREVIRLGVRAAVMLACVCAAATCGGSSEFRPRRVTLVSARREVDTALATARQAALEGDYERADLILREVTENTPNDPLAPLARLWRARLALARGETDRAARLAEQTDAEADPSLARTKQLVAGVVAERAGRSARALALLRPLEGTVPDRALTAEMSCALAAAEARAGEIPRALRALAEVERSVSEGVAWLPTGLSCEQPDSRLALTARLLERAVSPSVLATALDALPPDSPLRRPLAVRLRALATDLHQVPRWISWLADLPDDNGAAAPVAGDSRPAPIALGVLAPMLGGRAAVGAAIVRGAQYAAEADDNVRVIPEDEGETPEDAAAAFDRLVGRGARAVVGVSREDLAASVAIRAQALGVDVFLLAPPRGLDATGPRVHPAGPVLETRADALAEAAQGRASRALVLAPRAARDFATDVIQRLTARGIAAEPAELDSSAVRSGPDAGSTVRLVVGQPGREARAQLAHGAERAPARWIFEARAALPGGVGVWVGVRPGAAFESLLPQYCSRTGEPPEEMSLLAHDAARSAAAHVRGQRRPPGALASDFALGVALIEPRTAPGLAHGAPAAAAQCPAAAETSATDSTGTNQP